MPKRVASLPLVGRKVEAKKQSPIGTSETGPAALSLQVHSHPKGLNFHGPAAGHSGLDPGLATR